MYVSDVEAIADAAVGKYELSKNDPKKYLMRSVVAGFFLIIAIILSNVTAAVFFESDKALGKFLSAFLFPTAIVLIVFIGAELFTGNNMTMALGVYNKKCTWSQAVRVWVLSYIGNFAGSIILAFLFAKSNASIPLLAGYMEATVMGKLNLTPTELILRGILCNFMVCLAVLVGTRMKTETGKLWVMFCVIAAFVIAGFEHSIANMGIFSLAYLILDSAPAFSLVAKNMVFVTIGNIIGGAFLLAWPLKVMAIDDTK